MAPPPPDPTTVSSPVPPEARYEQLWEAKGPPDLSAFLARAGQLAPAQLAAVLCVDQRLRWANGERPIAQRYFDEYPVVAVDSTAAVDLVFNEYLLREQFGPPPDAGEFARRYPAQAAELETQVAFHAAVGGAGLTEETVSTWSAGRLVGRYRLVRPLGKGGMGTVFLAEDAELSRPVAIKVPHTAVWADPAGEARFVREARAAAALRHPHLCPIYDFGRAAGRCFFTMPFLKGETLRDRLAAGRPDARTAVDWTIKIARAVAALHRAGLVHRDLKPANVMFDEHGEPVVMDFGLVRSDGPADERLTTSGVVLGTPAYMPPEAVGGEPTGSAGDVYSLGVMLYEMLSGRLPFGGTRADMMAARLTQDPDPPSTTRRGLSKRFDAVCARAMARRPADRYPSMDAFADALKAARREDRPAGRGRRGLLIWIGAPAGLVAVALGVVLSLGPRGDRRPTTGPASLPATAANDGFAAGAVWVGDYRFRDGGDTADIHLEITERTEGTFRARYATIGGQCEWLADGTVTGDRVEWIFTKAVRGDPGGKESLVGQAHIVGTVAEGRFTGLFEYLNGGSPADVRLEPTTSSK